MNTKTPTPSQLHTPLRLDYSVRADGSICFALFGPRPGTHVQFDWPGTLAQVGELKRCINSHAAMRAALEKAVAAAEYAVKIIEANDKSGASDSPFQRADPQSTLAHVYAAMAFVTDARQALAQSGERTV